MARWKAGLEQARREKEEGGEGRVLETKERHEGSLQWDHAKRRKRLARQWKYRDVHGNDVEGQDPSVEDEMARETRLMKSVNKVTAAEVD